MPVLLEVSIATYQSSAFKVVKACSKARLIPWASKFSTPSGMVIKEPSSFKVAACAAWIFSSLGKEEIFTGGRFSGRDSLSACAA
jgi:hypothetical protein